jgi:gliding motility-associated-like protein
VDITVTLIDEQLNETSCEFSLTISDNQSPIIECVDTLILDISKDCNYAVPSFNELISFYDQCSEFSFVQTPEVGTVLYADTLATLVVTDIEGNTSECQFEMLLNFSYPPQISCPENQTLELLENCEAIVPDYLENLEVVYSCGGSPFKLEQLPEPGTYISEDTLVTIRVLDDLGNESTCEFSLVLVDNQAPIIICPDDMFSESSIVSYELPEVFDNCEVNLTLISGLESGSSFPLGITEINYLAIDESGNQSECSFIITVNRPPIAEDDMLFIETEAETFNALSNDYDLDGDELTLISAWTYNDSIDIDFTPYGNIEVSMNNEWCGLDSLLYIISDTYGAIDTGLVIIDKACFMELQIPTGFSPNGDGVNDTFVVTGIENFPENKISIFNRWGAEVFHALHYSNDWDGMSTNEFDFGKDILPVGTYFLILDLGDGSPIIKSHIFLNY